MRRCVEDLEPAALREFLDGHGLVLLAAVHGAVRRTHDRNVLDEAVSAQLLIAAGT